MKHVFATSVWVAVGIALGACGGNVQTSPGEPSCNPLPCPSPGWDPATCKCKPATDAGVGGAGGSGGTSNGGAAGSSNGGAAGAAGSAGAPGWFSCNEPYQCRLVDTDCCHMECFETSLGAFAAVNADYQKSYLDALCTPMPPCPGFFCPEEGHKQWIASSSQLGVTCEQGTCKGFDIRTSALSACTSDADCHLRWGLGCCESCSPVYENLVAVGDGAKLYDVLCGNIDVDCCPTPPFPVNAIAMCGPSSHCMVVWAK